MISSLVKSSFISILTLTFVSAPACTSKAPSVVPLSVSTQGAHAETQTESQTQNQTESQTETQSPAQTPASSRPSTPAPVSPATQVMQADSGTWSKADLTNYESYPDPGSEECVQYNGCTWEGQFAALPDKMPETWVKEHNIISIHAKDFAQYKLKTLRLRQGTHTIDATVYDECSDSDCDGCCTANSKKTGFLIDIEKYTNVRFGGGDGVVEWQCLDCK
ncbi:MAG: hypothetical protein H7249_13000 [Chitinophagaceae bacterium]|nr:hypothetical protein [Oligoflexus sp.]